MHPHADLITRFYEAFAVRDFETMASCYHPEIHFSDPAFPDLHGPRAGAMWRMLCERGKDLVITYSDVQADNQSGSAQWQAVYSFSATGRKVHNRILAEFRFEDGLIRRHKDTFAFSAWARQALGPVGYLLGWTPFLQRKVQRTAGQQLDRCCARWGIS